jgi:hypothetical protein
MFCERGTPTLALAIKFTMSAAVPLSLDMSLTTESRAGGGQHRMLRVASPSQAQPRQRAIPALVHRLCVLLEFLHRVDLHSAGRAGRESEIIQCTARQGLASNRI